MNGLIGHLDAHGDRLAVLTAQDELTYRELARRVDATRHHFGPGRRLILLETHNDVATLVRYLAALSGGHVVLPAPAQRDHAAVLETYRPDTVIDADGVHVRHEQPAHRMHADLSLLMSTSGSTGSPKLVRLSHTNLLSNAEAIAEYLDIRPTDRAATTLPMSYCYGLSVVHSHLLRGAGLILSDHSVVDDEFWRLFRRHRGTAFAGVPYTFELLDRVGFDAMDLPHLRYLTQAGGRLAPDQVRRYATLGRERGWDLFVMYGATEATARMAYLPAEFAISAPSAIGRPIPGGSFSVEPADGWTGDEGELVYHGPNVMMGYAHGPADLELGATLDALRTGDIARRRPDGLYEVVGRSSRFVKMYGLRIDLQRIETGLRGHGITALCAGDEDRLLVAATGGEPRDIQRLAASAAGVPAAAVHALAVAELPMLPSGKPDYQAVRELARADTPTAPEAADVRAVFGEVLHLDPATIDPDASFVDLGGNSLSYVAMSVRLQRVLGHLPTDWPRLPLRELADTPARTRAWGATLETSVALRAVAIVLIVGSHAGLFELWGGAHVLLGVAGYNFGRFCLTPVTHAERVRHLRATIAWIAVPSIAWIAFALAVTDDYHASNLLLANKFLGPYDSMTAGRLWFVEVLVWILIALAALLLVPAIDRLERRRPFAFAAAFVVLGLAVRYDMLGLGTPRDAWFTVLAFWFFAAGWAAAKATSVWQRALVTAVLAVGLHGYFADTHREMLVLAGLVLLIWVPALRCPAWLAVVGGVVAEASLYIYLTHYQVYPLFDGNPALGVAASVAAGVVLNHLVAGARRRVAERMRNGTRPAASPAAR